MMSRCRFPTTTAAMMMMMMTLCYVLTSLAGGAPSSATAFVAPRVVSTRRSTMAMARKGKLEETVGGGFGDDSSSKGESGKKKKRSTGGGSGGGLSSSSQQREQERGKINWLPVKGLQSSKELPQVDGKVQLVDTMADALINGATNPTGAVSVVKSGDSYYCFSSSCSVCKIPLAKAKVLPQSEQTAPHPRLVCDFCGATFNIRTGEPVEKAGKQGILGGMVSGLFSSQQTNPLPTYVLGEKNGKVVIDIDKW